MSEENMLVINHIEPLGLIAESGAELATAFCNTYFLQAVNEVAEQNNLEATHFMGSVAGCALAHMFQDIPLNQLDSVLSQIRSLSFKCVEHKTNGKFTN
jgi:hypothetical protein